MNGVPSPSSSPRRLGILLVLLCFLLSAACRGLTDSFSVYVLPWQAEFDADRAAVTGVYSVVGLGIGFGGLLTGWMVDRFGLRATALLGASAAGFGAVLASQATALWQIYLSFGLLVGLSGASLGGVLHAAMLGRWFSARLGTALAAAYSGNGIGYLLMTPTAQALIDLRDWRFALLAIGAGLLLILIPALLWLPWKTIAAGDPVLMDRRAPASRCHSKPPAGPTLGQAMRERAFWGLFFAFAMTSVGIYSLSPQVVACLIERGFDSGTAASAWGLTGLLLPLGMIGFNWLADRGGRLLGAGLAYAATIFGLLGLWLVGGPGDLLALAAFVVLFGSSMGSRGPMISTLSTLRYRGAHLGRIYGVITCGMGVGAAGGAWLGGYARDLTGGYEAVMAISACGLLLGAAPLLFEARARERAR